MVSYYKTIQIQDRLKKEIMYKIVGCYGEEDLVYVIMLLYVVVSSFIVWFFIY